MKQNSQKQQPWGLLSVLWICDFLAAMDQTIVSVAIPHIGNSFKALDRVAWVGTSFMLTSTAFQPLIGRLCHLFGISAVINCSLTIFLLASLGCGFARSMLGLIVARAICGLAAAGILAGTLIVIGEIVDLSKRPLMYGIASAVAGVANAVGPLTGGLIVDHISWRWCFYLNVPITAICLIGCWFLLTLPKPPGTLKSQLKEIDYLGVGLFVGGSFLLLLAISNAGESGSWNNWKIWGGLVLGFLILVVFVIWDGWFYTEFPIITIRLFRIRNVWTGCLSSFFIGACIYIGFYYVPLYYTATQGFGGTEAGIRFLPFVLSHSFGAIANGFLIKRSGEFWLNLIIGCSLGGIGSLLCAFLAQKTSLTKQVFVMLAYGLGTGMARHPTYAGIQCQVPQKDISLATPLSQAARMIGGTVGLAVFNSIYLMYIKSSLPELINEYPLYADEIEESISDTNVVWEELPSDVKDAVILKYLGGMKRGFIATASFALVATIFAISMKKINVRDTEKIRQKALDDEIREDHLDLFNNSSSKEDEEKVTGE